MLEITEDSTSIISQFVVKFKNISMIEIDILYKNKGYFKFYFKI